MLRNWVQLAHASIQILTGLQKNKNKLKDEK